MGGSSYHHDDYNAREEARRVSGRSGARAFMHNIDIAEGRTEARVHPSLDPKGKVRESRDSDPHPVTIPIGVILDTTGSMSEVPVMIQKALPNLMGGFLDDKASGKKYLGDAYPAILIGAVDDFNAQSMYGGAGALQVGQFESGMEIDDNLTNLWLTGNGGGTYEESYDLALYFFARHTVHDHWEKRHKKGYLFLIGDEKLYPEVDATAVKKIIGDPLQSSIDVDVILQEAKQRYHVFYILPKLTSHFGDPALFKYWQQKLGQQNVLKLEDPNKICEMIVSAVGICERHVNLDDLSKDVLVSAQMSEALTVLASSTALDTLPAVEGTAGAHRV